MSKSKYENEHKNFKLTDKFNLLVGALVFMDEAEFEVRMFLLVYF